MSSLENMKRLAEEYRQSGRALVERRDALLQQARQQGGRQRKFDLYQRVAMLEQLAGETFGTAARLEEYYDKGGDVPCRKAI